MYNCVLYQISLDSMSETWCLIQELFCFTARQDLYVTLIYDDCTITLTFVKHFEMIPRRKRSCGPV
jgi:hypothetical protein